MNLFTAVSGNNHLRWGNRTYDTLVAQGAAEHDPEKRRRIYDQAQQILTETEAPIISLFMLAQNRLVKPHVKGLNLNAMELLSLKQVRLDNADRPTAGRNATR
jgi:oligopeptide transport system substrate-binding protein